MGMSKTSTQEQDINPDLKEAALANLEQAKRVAALPYAPNRGITIAGLSPDQEAAFQNTNDAAAAFGLATGGSILPEQEVDPITGVSGYSTGDLYDANLEASLTPEQIARYKRVGTASGGGAANPASPEKGGAIMDYNYGTSTPAKQGPFSKGVR